MSTAPFAPDVARHLHVRSNGGFAGGCSPWIRVSENAAVCATLSFTGQTAITPMETHRLQGALGETRE
jgi:hypothetical protein